MAAAGSSSSPYALAFLNFALMLGLVAALRRLFGPRANFWVALIVLMCMTFLGTAFTAYSSPFSTDGLDTAFWPALVALVLSALSCGFAPAPADSSSTHTFFVQRRGAMGFAKLVTTAADVGDLVEEIKKALPSLRDVDSDSIMLQLASADGTLITAKDGAGKEEPVTLSSMASLDQALEMAAKAAGREIKAEDKLRIIVDVDSATPTAAADGECKPRVLRVRKQSLL
jgi:hypothetical protein